MGLDVALKLNSHSGDVKVVGTLTIGRSKDAGICVADNRLISGVHCRLDIRDGIVYLTNLSSTNGTIINGKKKLVGTDTTSLKDGDKVHLARKKNDPKLDVWFTVAITTSSPSVVDSPTFDLNKTVAYSPAVDSDNEDSSNDTMPPHDSPPPKKKLESEPDDSTYETPIKLRRLTEESVSYKSCKVVKETKIESPKSNVSAEKSSDHHHPDALPETSQKPGSSQKSASAVPSTDDDNKTVENLMCAICCDIIHNCVSLQPCLHSFCAGCYSEWMEKSNECPQCRIKVKRVSKFHQLNNIIDDFVMKHPEKKRSDSDLAALDSKNKITRDILYPSKQKKEPRHVAVYDDDSDPPSTEDENSENDEYNSDEDEGDDDDDDDAVMIVRNDFGLGQPNFILPPFGQPYLPPNPIQPPPAIYRAICRSCPQYAGNNRVKPDNFQCGLVQNHIMCDCCRQLFPDRGNEAAILPTVKCRACKKFYCNLYWTCDRVGCDGCLNSFADTNFNEANSRHLINGNAFESKVLLDYLTSKNLTVKDLLKDCLAKLDSHEFSCRDVPIGNIDSTSILCFTCALNNFRDLAYMYRKNIPNKDLPAHVTSRVDCWWGHDCRTQQNKPIHADCLYRMGHYKWICEILKNIDNFSSFLNVNSLTFLPMYPP